MGRGPQRRPRVRVTETIRQVLREAQVDAIVNRDDRATGRQRRQDVMRRMKQVDVLANAQGVRHFCHLEHGPAALPCGELMRVFPEKLHLAASRPG